MFTTQLRLKKPTTVVSATVVSKRPPESPPKPPQDTKPKTAKANVPVVSAKKKHPPDPIDPRPRSERVAETLAILQAEFPRLFPVTDADILPLAVGIRNGLYVSLKAKKAEGQFRSRSLISEAIACYQKQHPVYQEQLKVAGTPRIGLDGSEKGAVTEAEAQFAQQQNSL